MPFALLLSAALVAWSVVGNLVIGDHVLYVPRNLLFTALLLWLARHRGITWRTLGLDRRCVPRGLRWGAVTMVVVGAAILAGVHLADAIRPIAILLSDQRAAIAGADLAYAALVRIPLGTAVFEEVAFRGVLLAAFLQVMPVVRATWWSSAVFGLWHLAPTTVALTVNELVAWSPLGVTLIVGAVIVTTVAGALFTWLRWRSGSLVAPILAHVATNSFGLTAAAFVIGRVT